MGLTNFYVQKYVFQISIIFLDTFSETKIVGQPVLYIWFMPSTSDPCGVNPGDIWDHNIGIGTVPQSWSMVSSMLPILWLSDRDQSYNFTINWMLLLLPSMSLLTQNKKHEITKCEIDVSTSHVGNGCSVKLSGQYWNWVFSKKYYLGSLLCLHLSKCCDMDYFWENARFCWCIFLICFNDG